VPKLNLTVGKLKPSVIIWVLYIIYEFIPLKR
jgi:hypothetical protein